MKTPLIIITILLLSLSACRNQKEETAHAGEYYTCSMHPQIMQDKPGTCPICHMELIPVKKTNTNANEIMLNDEQIRLGNIQTDTLANNEIGDELILTATLGADETLVNSINARITGRIDRLYFKNPGDYLPKGSPLYDLYSEELNTAKQEYLVALEKKESLGNAVIDFDRLLQAAREKLLLWGMSNAQISQLEKTGQSSPLTTFYSNTAGYITELPVTEGQYVTEGNTIVRLADLSRIWVEAQAYSSQMSGMDLNGTTIVLVPDLPGKEWKGKIEFANPEIMPDSRLNLIRVSIPNPDGELKPGMPAYLTLKNRTAKTLTLPANAVLREENMNVVWVSSGKNRFTLRMVETGVESDGRIEIRSGLQKGDVPVVSGAYLLHSEYIFKKGTQTMNGMKM